MNSNTIVSESIKLTNTQAVEYLQFVKRNIQKQTSGAIRVSDATELNRLYLRLESAFRSWVNESVPTVPQRVLKYAVTTPVLKIQHWNFKELDVVCGKSRSQVETIIELKSPHSLRSKSKRQLRESLNIIQRRWPEARGVWVNLYLGDVLGTVETKSLPGMERCSPDWKSVLARSLTGLNGSQNDIHEVWLDGKEFIDLSVSRGWLAEDFTAQLEELREVVHPSESSLRHAQETAPINPFSDSLAQWIHQNHELKSN